jgi:hypothetical protein
MKYIRTLNYIICTVALFVMLFAALRVICLLFAALMPIIDGVLFWLGDHALWIGLVVAIGMILWVFGDSCDEQVEREKERG